MASLLFGFNFRGSSGFVTDAATDVPVLSSEAFPHTYTNANGQTISAGWTSGSAILGIDRDNTPDSRLAGIVLNNTGFPENCNFKIDLASAGGGAVAGSGAYLIRLAAGQVAGFGNGRVSFQILDTSTVLIDQTPDVAFTGGNFLDAALASYSTAAWPGSNAAVSKTFATTICNVLVINNATAYWGLFNHFRLAFVPATLIPRTLMPPMRAA